MRLPPGAWSGTFRRRLVWSLAILALALYNWWLILPLRPNLLHSPNELFSNLEVTGQPYSSWMQHADLVSGLLFLAVFLVVGWRSLLDGVLEWALLLVFAASDGIGGLYPEQCLDPVSRSCHTEVIELRLGGSQYLHMVSGVIEFGAITGVLYLSYRRTRAESTGIPRLYEWLCRGALVGYPLFGIAYLFVVGGSFVEAAFVAGISLVVISQLRERLPRTPCDAARSTELLGTEEAPRRSRWHREGPHHHADDARNSRAAEGTDGA